MIGRSLGRYRIVAKIGEGGMGHVFKAQDTRLGREVALKIMSPGTTVTDASRARFRNEARALSRLSHPNIATVHDFDSDGEHDFIVMEYIQGLPLSRKLDAGPLSVTEAVRIVAQVAAGLEEAHGAGVVHRDLKPANIIIDTRERAKLVDFGLAELVHPDDEDAVLTMSAAWGAAGTLPYMAPEQLRAGLVDARTDLFALGVVFYELLTGTRPFRDPNAARLIEIILHEDALPPGAANPKVPPALDRIVIRCLQKHPADRYQSALEIRAALDGLDLVPGPAPPRHDLAPIPQLVPAQVTSIVALPAVVHGGAADQFLTDAVPAALSARLAGIEGLDTRVPPTSFDVARVGGDMGTIARAYGVSTCVQSTVVIKARRLVLSVQLIDPRTRRLIWADDFEGSKAKYLDTVKRAAEALRAALRPGRPTPAASTTSGSGASEAEALAQRGFYFTNLYVNRGRPGDLDRAVSALEGALSRDPRRADAAEGLALLQLGRMTGGAPAADAGAMAAMWARRALDINPQSGRAWSVLSELENGETVDGSSRKLEFALRGATLGPRDAFTQSRLGAALARRSLWLGVAASREASRLDPLVLAGPMFEAITELALGRADNARARADHALGLEPDSPFGLLVKALVLAATDGEAEALGMLPRLEALAGERRIVPQWIEFVRVLATFVRAAKGGDRAAADAAAEYLASVGRGASPFPRWQSFSTGLVTVLVRYGRPQAALDMLAARADAGVVDCLDLFLLNPDHAPVFDDARFQRAVDLASVQFRGLLASFADARARAEVPAYLEQELAVLLRNLEAARTKRGRIVRSGPSAPSPAPGG